MSWLQPVRIAGLHAGEPLRLAAAVIEPAIDRAQRQPQDSGAGAAAVAQRKQQRELHECLRIAESDLAASEHRFESNWRLRIQASGARGVALPQIRPHARLLAVAAERRNEQNSANGEMVDQHSETGDSGTPRSAPIR
jgi:hypothetical protein